MNTSIEEIEEIVESTLPGNKKQFAASGLRRRALPTPAFDYNTIAADLAEDLRSDAHRIYQRITKSTSDLIEIGRDLNAVKARLAHGQFVHWVESEIGIHPRSAQRYIQVADLADAKGDMVSLLTPAAAYRLSARTILRCTGGTWRCLPRRSGSWGTQTRRSNARPGSLTAFERWLRAARAGPAEYVNWADSNGRRNTLKYDVAMCIRKRRSDRSGRAPLPSPGRPPVAGRDERSRFWLAIAAGMSSEDAAVEAGVSQPVGTRWFRKAGGMPPAMFRPSAKPLSGRYLAGGA